MRGTGGVGAHQYRTTPVLVGFAQVCGQLRQRGVEHFDVVGGGVGAGVARAQQPGQRLPGTAGAVIGVAQQRVKAKGFFQVRVADSLSECAVTRVASRSITAFPSWTGAPAQPIPVSTTPIQPG